MDHILYWNAVALEANRRDFSNLPGTDSPSPEQGGPTLSSGSGIESGDKFGADVAQQIRLDRLNDPDAASAGYFCSSLPGHHRPSPADPGQGVHAPYYGANSTLFAATARHSLDLPATYVPSVTSGTEYDRAIKQVRGKGIAPELMGTLPSTYSKRTVDETLIGLYWAYDGPNNIGTPPRLYNQIARTVAQTVINPATGAINTVDDNARLFAFVNAALGDAGILAWEEKYKHDVWRPVLGIREHDQSMGPAAPLAKDNIDNDCDPDWLPLGAPASNSYVSGTGKIKRNFTPDFPAYPSGHATFGAAALHMLRLFYGVPAGSAHWKKDTIFEGPFISDEVNGVTADNSGVIRPRHVRHFRDGLWQMIVENGLSRIYLGVHWFFDAFALDSKNKPDLSQDRIGGVPLGLRIAEDIFTAGVGTAPKKP